MHNKYCCPVKATFLSDSKKSLQTNINKLTYNADYYNNYNDYNKMKVWPLKLSWAINRTKNESDTYQ